MKQNFTPSSNEVFSRFHLEITQLKYSGTLKARALQKILPGAGLSLFIILPREGSIDNGNFGTDDGINGMFSQ